MNIPTRWHKPSCDTPQVVLDSNVPECRACGSTASALLQRAAEDPNPSYSGIRLPPEAPIGQMNLWWPPCVPYTRDGAPRVQPRASSFEDAASLTPHASDSSLSEIYTSTLGKDQFRLLYISGARGIDSPIHGNLVEYERANCPEYETVSYTWGGEDGDATPCRPAYLGDFWDVLFLTRNCWSLLQYLRPHMGTRVVWVDAICINQNNIPERSAQVSVMTQIYRNCLRVVIYPGDHLVRKDEHRFRERIRHDDITELDGLCYVDGSGFDIWNSVSKSRYINRIWIIQELILAPRSTLALKNHDIYLENGLLHRIGGKDSQREWLEFMGQSNRLCQTTFYEALKMTSYSQATDPRDKIFGILGVLGPNRAYSEIRPEYSLSMRDCVIGAIGLILLTSKEFWPLLNSQKSNTTPQYPSWLPSLDEIASWTDEVFLNSVAPGSLSLKIPGEWATVINLNEYRPPRIRKTLSPDGSDSEGDNEDANLTGRQLLFIGPGMPWHQDASLNSNTAALTLRLVRLFDTPHKMVEGPNLHELSTRWLFRGTYADPEESFYHVKGPSSAVCFVTTRKPMRHEHPCYLFLAFHVKSTRLQKDAWPDMSLLRKAETYLLFADEAEASGSFRLLGCCRLDDVKFLSASPLLSQSSRSVSRVEPGVHNMLSLFDILDRILHYEPQDNLSNDGECEAKFFDLTIPGEGATIPGYLHLGLVVARTERPASITKEFRRAYMVCLQSRSGDFNPVLDDEDVWFTLVDKVAVESFGDSLLRHLPFQTMEAHPLWMPWMDFFPPWFDLQIPEIGNTEFANTGCVGYSRLRRCGEHQDYGLKGGRARLNHWLPCAPEPKQLQFPVMAKMPLTYIVKGIRITRLHWLLRCLLAFGEKLGEDAETLLERGPQPQDSNIYLQEWPQSLVDELDFVWRSEMVTFV